MAENIEDSINSEVTRGKSLINKVRSGARRAFLGAKRALPAIQRSAKLGDPTLSFITGAVASTPSAEESTAERLLEFGRKSVGEVAPDFARQLQELHGIDPSTPIIAVEQFIKPLMAAETLRKQRELLKRTAPFSPEDRKFLMVGREILENEPRHKKAMLLSDKAFRQFLVDEDRRIQHERALEKIRSRPFAPRRVSPVRPGRAAFNRFSEGRSSTTNITVEGDNSGSSIPSLDDIKNFFSNLISDSASGMSDEERAQSQRLSDKFKTKKR